MRGSPTRIRTPESRESCRRLDLLGANDIVRRVWAGDHTVWGNDPAEIANRLGWLRVAQSMREHIASLREFADTVRAECDAVALLGMGGSSLAPETLAKTAQRVEGPRLAVLDTTHPTTVRRTMSELAPQRTFYLVSTKSGTTTETLSLFRIFHRQAERALGRASAGARFAAITDPGSRLVALARECGFRRVFLNDPTIGGRYSALSLVGLVPAALLGLDLGGLLDSAELMASACGPSVPVEKNPAAVLAASLAASVAEGRDKATFILPDALLSFGDWLEQLLAESTGKHGTGVVPIVSEAPATPSAYGDDRVFVSLGSQADTPEPTLGVEFPGVEALGGQFFLWELATALLGHLMGLNPFDQPDVEAAKQAARDILSAHEEQGGSPNLGATSLSDAELHRIAALARPGDYIALLAYLDPLPETAAALSSLRVRLRDATRCATTVGFGPRFLHSTGQLHKGDGGRGLFIEFVDEPSEDVEIPGDGPRPQSLRLLIRAQALGDAHALGARGRRITLFDLEGDPSTALRAIAHT